MSVVYYNPGALHYSILPSGLPDPRATIFHQHIASYAPSELLSLPEVAQDLQVGYVFLKNESARLHPPGPKILGVSWATYRAVTQHLGLTIHPDRSIEDLARAAQHQRITLMAAADGNHGRAVARMARLLGLKCCIFVPMALDDAIKAIIAEEGAEVLEVKGGYDLAVKEASETADRTDGGILIQEDAALDNYEDIPKWIVDGYSTMLTEMDEQVFKATEGKHADIIIVPVGFGSLAQAVVTHFKQPERTKHTKIITVEPDTAACLKRCLLAGSDTPSSILTSPTIMTSLNRGTVSPIAWPLLRSGVDVAMSVTDMEAHRAIKDLHTQGIAVGPCGAAPFAALRQLASRPDIDILKPNSVVVVLATEGPRDYPQPLDTTTTDPVVLTQILTRIDSSNPDLSQEAGAGESAIADYLLAWLTHHGFETHRLEAHHGRPSVVGVARGSGGGRTLMFNGHIDTVTLAGYDGNPLSGEVVDGAVHGRGSFDMKAGIAASLVAAYRARDKRPLTGDIVLALVADEENLSLGTQELLSAGWRADGAVVSEPTNHGLMLSHKGFVWAEIDIIGKAGHGSLPDLSIDAITKAGHFLLALEQYGKALLNGEVEGAVRHEQLGTGTVHASLIKGGEEMSSYPALCTVSIERRTVPGETTHLVKTQLRMILDEIVERIPDFKYGLRMGDSRSPFGISQEHAFVKTFARHATETLEKPPRIMGAPYWADSALLADVGIPVVLFGVQGEGAHASREWAAVDSIEKVTRTLTEVAVDFCS